MPACRRRRDRRPSKRYRPEDFGVDADELTERFAFYAERFKIPVAGLRKPA
jgi:hypothetical protein